jgi:peptidoglycan/xylan/chitin deacetylase (PgdA/CDA1 family)
MWQLGLIAVSAVVIFPVLYAIWRICWGYPPGDQVRILAYHKISRFESGGTWISPRRFEKQIDSMLGRGVRFIDEKDFILALEGRRSPGRGEVLLTFDDGYESFADHAAGLLSSRGIPALVFLVTGYMGSMNTWELGIPGRRARHMDWETVHRLIRRGFSFGSHGVSHRRLDTLPTEEIRRELVLSKQHIESNCRITVNSLSYPYGRSNGTVREESARAGYRAAFTMYPRSHSTNVDPFEIRRDGVWVIDTPATITLKLSREGWFWLEDIKGRAINAVADVAAVLSKNSQTTDHSRYNT